MTHQCPKCELRFAWHTELDDHCRTDHPDFQHVYPASVHHDNSPPAIHAAGQPAPRAGHDEQEQTAAILNTWWGER